MVCLHTDTMGVHPACILFDGQGYSPPRPGIPPETTPPILHILPLIAHQLASARQNFLALASWCARTGCDGPSCRTGPPRLADGRAPTGERLPKLGYKRAGLGR